MHTLMIICTGLVLFVILAFSARLVPALRPHYFIVFLVPVTIAHLIKKKYL